MCELRCLMWLVGGVEVGVEWRGGERRSKAPKQN
jgi:hypothetical protein